MMNRWHGEDPKPAVMGEGEQAWMLCSPLLWLDLEQSRH